MFSHQMDTFGRSDKRTV